MYGRPFCFGVIPKHDEAKFLPLILLIACSVHVSLLISCLVLAGETLNAALTLTAKEKNFKICAVKWILILRLFQNPGTLRF